MDGHGNATIFSTVCLLGGAISLLSHRRRPPSSSLEADMSPLY
jgi:hypothetical protein